MKKTNYLPVIFRMEKGNDGSYSPVAVFPTEKYNPRFYGNSVVECYAHNGQHDRMFYGYYQTTKPATKKEYEPLLKELKEIGYRNLKVYKKWFSCFDR